MPHQLATEARSHGEEGGETDGRAIRRRPAKQAGRSCGAVGTTRAARGLEAVRVVPTAPQDVSLRDTRRIAPVCLRDSVAHCRLVVNYSVSGH